MIFFKKNKIKENKLELTLKKYSNVDEYLLLKEFDRLGTKNIFISGRAGCGKTELTKRIIKSLGERNIAVLSSEHPKGVYSKSEYHGIVDSCDINYSIKRNDIIDGLKRISKKAKEYELIIIDALIIYEDEYFKLLSKVLKKSKRLIFVSNDEFKNIYTNRYLIDITSKERDAFLEIERPQYNDIDMGETRAYNRLVH